MSYSRWSHSRWYTYYDVSSEEGIKDKQVFTVCGEQSFYYEELRDDLEGCLRLMQQKDPEANPKDMDELRGYMKDFMEDVDLQFKRIDENNKRNNKGSVP